MTYAIKIPEMPKNFFVIMFAAMYTGMAPIISMASIIAEEKEKNTLRILRMSNVTAGQYLISVSGYIMLMCLMGTVVMGLVGGYRSEALILFTLVMAAGIITSVLIGAIIGIVSRSQMNATALVMPVMIVFAFLPMISMFNDKVEKISRFIYSQQVSNMLSTIGSDKIKFESVVILFINILMGGILFAFMYRKHEIEM